MQKSFDTYREDYKWLSEAISERSAQIEEKENEILSISDRLTELLAEKSSPENKAQYARAREKRTRLREECVSMRAELRDERAKRDWLMLEVKIFYGGSTIETR